MEGLPVLTCIKWKLYTPFITHVSLRTVNNLFLTVCCTQFPAAFLQYPFDGEETSCTHCCRKSGAALSVLEWGCAISSGNLATLYQPLSIPVLFVGCFFTRIPSIISGNLEHTKDFSQFLLLLSSLVLCVGVGVSVGVLVSGCKIGWVCWRHFLDKKMWLTRMNTLEKESSHVNSSKTDAKIILMPHVQFFHI